MIDQECKYEYGELIEVNSCDSTIGWNRRTFLFQLPDDKGVCCSTDREDPIKAIERFEALSSHVIVWPNHRKIEKPKEPEYEPYTYETFKPHRDKWFKVANCDDLVKVSAYNKYFVFLWHKTPISWESFLGNYIHEDGTPCGTLKEYVR